MKVKVQKLDGTAVKGDLELSDDVFGIEPRQDILHRVVTWQLWNRRATARPTRERSEVSRTGKKFGRQKGGGTARHGDRAAPVFIGGGTLAAVMPQLLKLLLFFAFTLGAAFLYNRAKKR